MPKIFNSLSFHSLLFCFALLGAFVSFIWIEKWSLCVRLGCNWISIIRSSTSTAAAAFAIATSASSNPRDDTFEQSTIKEMDDRVVSSPATIRVLNVLRCVFSQCAASTIIRGLLNQFYFFFQALGFKAFPRFWTRCHFASTNN